MVEEHRRGDHQHPALGRHEVSVGALPRGELLLFVSRLRAEVDGLRERLASRRREPLHSSVEAVRENLRNLVYVFNARWGGAQRDRQLRHIAGLPVVAGAVAGADLPSERVAGQRHFGCPPVG